MGEALERLKERLGEIDDLICAERILDWDQQTCMPRGGGEQRARHLSTLSRLIHQKFTDPETLRLLDAAERETESLSEDDDDRRLVQVTRYDYERSAKLPESFVAERTRDSILSSEVWRDARSRNDFPAFLPHLEKMVDYARRAADFYGYDAHPYDALLEDYERGLTTAEVERIFDALRTEQVALVREIAGKEKPQTHFLRRHYPTDLQERFALKVSEDFGYDLRRGRLDVAPHPFETSFGRDDVRITTRNNPNDLKQSLFAIWHETGHALYEQNISPSLAGTPMSGGCSNVFHESQSRLWENVVARSRAFWERYFPLLKETFPDQLADVTAEEMHRAVNRVEPSLIRVEADEVTYNLHIMIRFDLEKALIEGSATARELPGLWAEKMEEYLGVFPPDDRDGAMQDVHWAGGSFGYFPTYALGNVMSAQILETASAALPNLESSFLNGYFSYLLKWLEVNIYQNGRKYPPKELALRVNGATLDPKPYLKYLRTKYSEIYKF